MQNCANKIFTFYQASLSGVLSKIHFADTTFSILGFYSMREHWTESGFWLLRVKGLWWASIIFKRNTQKKQLKLNKSPSHFLYAKSGIPRNRLFTSKHKRVFVQKVPLKTSSFLFALHWFSKTKGTQSLTGKTPELAFKNKKQQHQYNHNTHSSTVQN